MPYRFLNQAFLFLCLFNIFLWLNPYENSKVVENQPSEQSKIVCVLKAKLLAQQPLNGSFNSLPALQFANFSVSNLSAKKQTQSVFFVNSYFTVLNYLAHIKINLVENLNLQSFLTNDLFKRGPPIYS